MKLKIPANTKFAADLFGSDYFGPREVEKVFGCKRISKDELPPLPSKDALMKAKTLGHYLYLEMPEAANEVLAVRGIHARLGNKLGEGLLFRNMNWYTENNGQNFFNEPFGHEPKWRFASRKIIAGTTGKNYLEQTELLAEYVRRKVCGKKGPIRDQYENAFLEFQEQKETLSRLLSNDERSALEALTGLQINTLFRETAGQAVYRLALYYGARQKYLLSNMETWTRSVTSHPAIVRVGRFTNEGIGIIRSDAQTKEDILGVCFACDAAPQM